MMKKLVWHNRPCSNGYVINATSDYTDEQLIIEIPSGTSYDKFHELVDNKVFRYLVDVHNAIVNETKGFDGLFHNISISANVISNNLYDNYLKGFVS